jgi:osmoprotectant transport system substrate-binding protein
MILRKLLFVALVVSLFLGVVSSAPSHAQATPIRVGSKPFTENILLAHIIMIALQNAGYNVADQTSLGDTTVNRQALLNDVIDVYPEYTGTALTNFYGDLEWVTIPDGTVRDGYLSYATVSSLDAAIFDMIWLRPAPANNTFAIVVTQEFAETNSLVTMEDFARYISEGGEIYLAASEDFLLRPDALPAFEKTYGFQIPGEKMLVIAGAFPNLTEQALHEGVNGITASFAFSTDALIKEYNLVVLTDTLFAQPIYQPAAVFRGSIVRENPQIVAILNPIFATLDDATLQTLNAQVEVEGKTAADVAREYLIQEGFIEEEE